MRDFLENHDTTKNILLQHPFATKEDVFAFFNEDILGRGNRLMKTKNLSSLEAAKEIYENLINCCGYFDTWYKNNRNSKWYAEMREKKLF